MANRFPKDLTEQSTVESGDYLLISQNGTKPNKIAADFFAEKSKLNAKLNSATFTAFKSVTNQAIAELQDKIANATGGSLSQALGIPPANLEGYSYNNGSFMWINIIAKLFYMGQSVVSITPYLHTDGNGSLEEIPLNSGDYYQQYGIVEGDAYNLSVDFTSSLMFSRHLSDIQTVADGAEQEDRFYIRFYDADGEETMLRIYGIRIPTSSEITNFVSKKVQAGYGTEFPMDFLIAVQ